MNVSEFLNLLQNPDTVLSSEQTRHLEELLIEYPYFQAARALYLKGLKTQESYKYNNELKKTAAYTTDREVLFDFITSENFNIQQAEEKASHAMDLTTKNVQLDEGFKDISTPREDQQISHADEVDIEPEFDLEENVIELAETEKPLSFNQGEKHSFLEWLQLTSGQSNNKTEDQEQSKEKKKKFELLDRFIENNPKIVPKETEKVQEINIKESLKLDKEEVMTETLANIYVEQQKYKKAIKAYEILSLKNPEKSSFFADRIKAVEKLRKEKD